MDLILLLLNCFERLKHFTPLPIGIGGEALLVLCVYKIDNGVVLDFGFVLADVLRHGGTGRLIHVLQGLQGDDLRGHAAGAVHVELDVLGGDIGACVLHHLTEGGFGNIEALHAVVVEDAEVDLDELVADKDAGDARLDTLLSEAGDDAVEVGAFLQADALHGHVVEELEAESGALTCLGRAVYHRLDERLVDILGTGNGVELLGVVLLDFLDNLGLLFLLAFLLGVAGERVDHLLPLASFLGFLFLVTTFLFGLVLPLAFHAAVLDAVELTGIGVEVFLLAPATAAIAASAIAVDTVHVGTADAHGGPARLSSDGDARH
jgi:hypothetical protein